MNLTFNILDRTAVVGAHKLLSAILSGAVDLSEKLNEVIHPQDNPATGINTGLTPDAARAQAAFGGGGTPLTPEAMIAAHAAGQLAPPPAISIVPPAPTLNPAAQVPGGAAQATAPQPPAAPVAPAAGPTVDARGIRWDSRIHSGGKTLVADGTWRKAKGVSDELVAQVEAEQRALQALPPAAPTAPAAPQAPAVTAATPPVPQPPAAPPVPQAPAEQPAMTYAQFCEWINGPMLANPPKLTMDEMNAALARAGIPTLQALMMRPDYVPQVHADLAAIVASKG